MKKLILLFVLLFAGCMSKYQYIGGYKNIQKNTERWCKIGCTVGLEAMDGKPTYVEKRKCFDRCVELSWHDIEYRQKKEKCSCEWRRR